MMIVSPVSWLFGVGEAVPELVKWSIVKWGEGVVDPLEYGVVAE